MITQEEKIVYILTVNIRYWNQWWALLLISLEELHFQITFVKTGLSKWLYKTRNSLLNKRLHSGHFFNRIEIHWYSAMLKVVIDSTC